MEIHDLQIKRYGGSDGLRDPGALESAVATPGVTFDGFYLHATIPAMAAAYLFHLARIIRPSTATSASAPTPRLRSY